jgi:uncharacterized membrane protein (UPF0127 family)
MKHVLIRNLTQPGAPALRARYCVSFLCRLRGLMMQRSLPPCEGLLLVQPRDSRVDSAIHMLFMRMDLAAVWINSDYRVVDVQHARRWRPVYVPQHPARYVLETAPEQMQHFAVGDRLAFDADGRS